MIKSFFKGVVIGIANIVPGVSGGTMMVSMGIYDKLIHCITHLFSEFKKSVLLRWAWWRPSRPALSGSPISSRISRSRRICCSWA